MMDALSNTAAKYDIKVRLFRVNKKNGDIEEVYYLCKLILKEDKMNIINIIKSRSQIEAEAMAAEEAAMVAAAEAEAMQREEAEAAARAALPVVNTQLINMYFEAHNVDQKFFTEDGVSMIKDVEVGVEFSLSNDQYMTLEDNVRSWLDARVSKATTKALKAYAK